MERSWMTMMRMRMIWIKRIWIMKLVCLSTVWLAIKIKKLKLLTLISRWISPNLMLSKSKRLDCNLKCQKVNYQSS